MPRASATPTAPQDLNVEWLPTDELLFDDSNPRLSEEAEADDGGDPQQRILLDMWREFAVDEIALSVAANGYFPHEPLFVAREGDGLVVIEGNRRLAAVKLLRDASLRQAVGATDLPRITAAQRRDLDQLPALVLQREDVWEYLGFKHVNGPQAWQSYSKAQYIAKSPDARSLRGALRSIGTVLLGLTLAATSLAGSALTAPVADEIPIKATPGIDELEPAAGGGYFAWSQNSRARPDHFDAFAQRLGGRPFRVNARNTQGRVGAISGTTLAYQQIRERQSDIKLLNLRTRRRSDPPRGVNTKDWESRPALSGGWLLFSRLDRSKSIERLLLRNLKTGEERTLSSVDEYPDRRFLVGQVSGNYAVATFCLRRCRTGLYDLKAKSFVRRRSQPFPETQFYAPSVTSEGTTYFASVDSLNRCTPYSETGLLRFVLDEVGPTTVKTFPPQLGVDSTYAVSKGGKVIIYYSRGICTPGASDIHALTVNQMEGRG